ncbi:MAG: hypothetical protein IKA23_02005 [Akkermansia sp.]|nr:hypothetical protein [Akkermansia sp.]MBR2313340.1 hypothetical protein [Akkermansia sp.]
MRFILTAILFLSAAVSAADFPWSQAAPDHIRQAAVLPDAVMDETPCNWRPVLSQIFPPMVKQCRTAREAVLHIAANIGAVTGAYYSTERRKHNMNALEALAEKKISCTGQSILLVCALRSVDIPARAVGVHTWNHIPGNHTWVEAWCDGEWHMIEFNEKDFNTSWVMEYIGMLNPTHPAQRILASSPDGNTTWWFTDFARQNKLTNFRAEDVTERYTELARLWYQQNGLPAGVQRLLVDVTPRQTIPILVEVVNSDNDVVSSGVLPTESDDLRFMTRLTLPRTGEHVLRISNTGQQIPISSTSQPVRILHIFHELTQP